MAGHHGIADNLTEFNIVPRLVREAHANSAGLFQLPTLLLGTLLLGMLLLVTLLLVTLLLGRLSHTGVVLAQGVASTNAAELSPWHGACVVFSPTKAAAVLDVALPSFRARSWPMGLKTADARTSEHFKNCLIRRTVSIQQRELPMVRPSAYRLPFPAGLHSLEREFERLLGSNGKDQQQQPNWPAGVEIWEDETQVSLELDLPGVTEDHLEVALHNGELTVRTERELPAGNRNYLVQNRRYGPWQGTFQVPETIDPDNVSAELTAGVLKIRLSKRPQAQTRKIPVKAN